MMTSNGVSLKCRSRWFWVALAALLALAAVLISCGCNSGGLFGRGRAARLVDVDAALAELARLDAPAGVDEGVFTELKNELRRQLSLRGKVVATPPPIGVNDLAEVPTPGDDPPIIRWSSRFFVADGNLDGSVSISDVTPIAVNFLANTFTNPSALVADYNRDGEVNIQDITPLAINFGQTVGHFLVQRGPSATALFFTDVNTVQWNEQLEERSSNGCALFEYHFTAADLPDADDMWVRVLAYDKDGNLGQASPAIHIEIVPVAPFDFYVTDLLIQATGTVNTDVGSGYEGGDYYVTPDTGGNTEGEAPANTHIEIVLADIAYNFNSTPYDFGAEVPAELVDEIDGIMATLHASMDYTVASAVVPADPEAWAEDATQPTLGYAGRLGPNDAGSVLITAHMNDSQWTLDSQTFDVIINLSLTEDVNAPQVKDFSPRSGRQDELQYVQVMLDWGDDETGSEEPSAVQLYTAGGPLAMSFNPDSPLVTDDPPDESQKYTLKRVSGNPQYTTVLTVWVPGESLAIGDYKWRVAESAGGFDRRSSLKKPTTVFKVLASDPNTMFTWPEDEFCTNDPAQPYLYLFPKDPIIRRNPMVKPGSGQQPPPVVIVDPEGYNDIVKQGTGQWDISYGHTEPGFPRIHYKWGDTPPTTIAQADGTSTVFEFQRWMLAGAVVDLWDPGEGVVAFSLFGPGGAYLGYSAVRTATKTALTRGAPVITGECDFGVRPWGADGSASAPDFSDKTASIASKDAVIFTIYNYWYRHDDNVMMRESWRSTHLVLKKVPGGAIDHIEVLPVLFSTDNYGLAYLLLDVSSPWWWDETITGPLDTGEYEVTFETPGAGTATFGTTHLTVVN